MLQMPCIHCIVTPPSAGSFAPAGPHTIWKKRLNKENTETVAYQMLMKDSVHDIVPTFYREVEYNGDCILGDCSKPVTVCCNSISCQCLAWRCGYSKGQVLLVSVSLMSHT